MYGRMDSNFARFWPTHNEKEVGKIMKRDAVGASFEALRYCKTRRRAGLRRFRRLLKGGKR